MKYYGKEKCRILKEIRAAIAQENDIEWVTSECRHQGNCQGTCPKCEREVRELEAALAKREAMGKKVAVVGISAAIALSVTGCTDPFSQTQGQMLDETGRATEESSVEVLMGDPVPLFGETEPVVMGEETEPVEETTADMTEETAETCADAENTEPEVMGGAY